MGSAPAPSASGRSGGDTNVKLSPWVQGLYNKTHNSQGDGFDAYTQGFAFGADIDLTDAWTAGIGLTAAVDNFEFKFDYDAALRSENNTQGVNLKAIYHF